MNELRIKYIPISDLKPYEHNARKHEDKDIEAIIASIREFGFDDPVGVWSDENVIVEGHGRVMAAQRLGMTEVPCIRLDHLTDEQRRAYALAHNRTAELSEWDFTVRDDELQGITEIDMELFGFAVDDAPDVLDDEEPQTNDRKYVVKMTFDNYADYKMWEDEIKETAERMGCVLSLVKDD